jgi:ABC-type lipoprotein release transport system permease subunit
MIWKLAVRNVWRDARRTRLMALSLAFAAFVGTVGHTLVGSLDANVTRGLREGLVGDLQVFDRASRSVDITEEPAAGEALVTRPEETERLILADPAVRAVAPRLRAPGLLISGELEAPAILIGVDPDKEAASCPGFDPLALRALTEKKVVLGSGIADRLGLEAGEELTLLLPTPDGLFEGDVLEVGAVYAPPGLSLFGETLAFVRLPELQELLGLEGRVGSLVVALNPGAESGAARERLETALGPRDLKVASWVEVAGPLVEIGRIGTAGMTLTNLLLWLVIALGIGNTFLIIVLERRREIGTMMALGTTRLRIVGVILLESGLISGAAAAAGGLAAAALCLPLASHGIPAFTRAMAFAFGADRLYPVLTWSHLALGMLFVLLLGPLAALLPALFASRADPVRALRSA